MHSTVCGNLFVHLYACIMCVCVWFVFVLYCDRQIHTTALFIDGVCHCCVMLEIARLFFSISFLNMCTADVKYIYIEVKGKLQQLNNTKIKILNSTTKNDQHRDFPGGPPPEY